MACARIRLGGADGPTCGLQEYRRPSFKQWCRPAEAARRRRRPSLQRRDHCDPTPSTFELVGATKTSFRSTFVTIVVYQPGGEPVSTQFFDELSAVLEQVAAYSCPVVVTGDLNHSLVLFQLRLPRPPL